MRKVQQVDPKARRRGNTSRKFTDPSPFVLLKGGGKPYENSDYIWLAMRWLEMNNNRYPSKREILEGLLEEVSKQDCGTMQWTPEYEKQRGEIMEARTSSFQALFQLMDLSNGDLDDLI